MDLIKSDRQKIKTAFFSHLIDLPQQNVHLSFYGMEHEKKWKIVQCAQ